MTKNFELGTRKETVGNYEYKSRTIMFKGSAFRITYVTTNYGTAAYLNVHKLTNNPYGLMGNCFASWDEACKHYKSPEMKTELLMAEIEFKTL